ncbi:energy transducer TonB family protein [Frateuria aurantia]|uniref:energy transducer TonB family protein n=1 Tax=Frateuria aurantia TaxID=81475 RepID=UPI0012EAAD74|nr:energy transducer TonB [Frateuria aurantia]
MIAHGLVIWQLLRIPVPIPITVSRPAVQRIQLTLRPPAAPRHPVETLVAKTPSPPRSTAPRTHRPPHAQRPQPVASQWMPALARATEPNPDSAPAAELPAPASQPASPPSPSLPPADRTIRSGDDSWEARLLARLEHYRRYPAQARRGHQHGLVVLRLKIDRDGALLAADIVQGCGHAMLDREALATARRARQLPPIPPEKSAPRLVDIPVEFHLR